MIGLRLCVIVIVALYCSEALSQDVWDLVDPPVPEAKGAHLVFAPFDDQLTELFGPAYAVYAAGGSREDAGAAMHDAAVERQVERLRQRGDDAAALMYMKNESREYERYLRESGESQSQVAGDPEVQRLVDFGNELQKAVANSNDGETTGRGHADVPDPSSTDNNGDDSGPPGDEPMTIGPPD